MCAVWGGDRGGWEQGKAQIDRDHKRPYSHSTRLPPDHDIPMRSSSTSTFTGSMDAGWALKSDPGRQQRVRGAPRDYE